MDISESSVGTAERRVISHLKTCKGLLASIQKDLDAENDDEYWKLKLGLSVETPKETQRDEREDVESRNEDTEREDNSEIKASLSQGDEGRVDSPPKEETMFVKQDALEEEAPHTLFEAREEPSVAALSTERKSVELLKNRKQADDMQDSKVALKALNTISTLPDVLPTDGQSVRTKPSMSSRRSISSDQGDASRRSTRSSISKAFSKISMKSGQKPPLCPASSSTSNRDALPKVGSNAVGNKDLVIHCPSEPASRMDSSDNKKADSFRIAQNQSLEEKSAKSAENIEKKVENKDTIQAQGENGDREPTEDTVTGSPSDISSKFQHKSNILNKLKQTLKRMGSQREAEPSPDESEEVETSSFENNSTKEVEMKEIVQCVSEITMHSAASGYLVMKSPEDSDPIQVLSNIAETGPVITSDHRSCKSKDSKRVLQDRSVASVSKKMQDIENDCYSRHAVSTSGSLKEIKTSRSTRSSSKLSQTKTPEGTIETGNQERDDNSHFEDFKKTLETQPEEALCAMNTDETKSNKSSIKVVALVDTKGNEVVAEKQECQTNGEHSKKTPELLKGKFANRRRGSLSKVLKLGKSAKASIVGLGEIQDREVSGSDGLVMPADQDQNALNSLSILPMEPHVETPPPRDDEKPTNTLILPNKSDAQAADTAVVSSSMFLGELIAEIDRTSPIKKSVSNKDSITIEHAHEGGVSIDAEEIEREAKRFVLEDQPRGDAEEPQTSSLSQILSPPQIELPPLLSAFTNETKESLQDRLNRTLSLVVSSHELAGIFGSDSPEAIVAGSDTAPTSVAEDDSNLVEAPSPKLAEKSPPETVEAEAGEATFISAFEEAAELLEISPGTESIQEGSIDPDDKNKSSLVEQESTTVEPIKENQKATANDSLVILGVAGGNVDDHMQPKTSTAKEKKQTRLGRLMSSKTDLKKRLKRISRMKDLLAKKELQEKDKLKRLLKKRHDSADKSDETETDQVSEVIDVMPSEEGQTDNQDSTKEKERKQTKVMKSKQKKVVKLKKKEKKTEERKAKQDAKKAKEEEKRAKLEAKKAKVEVKKAKQEAEAAKEEAKRAKDEAKRAKEEVDRAMEEEENARKEAGKQKEELQKVEEAVSKQISSILEQQGRSEQLLQESSLGKCSAKDASSEGKKSVATQEKDGDKQEDVYLRDILSLPDDEPLMILPPVKTISWCENVKEIENKPRKSSYRKGRENLQDTIWWSNSSNAVEVLYDVAEEEEKSGELDNGSDIESYDVSFLSQNSFDSSLVSKINFSFSSLKQVTSVLVEEATVMGNDIKAEIEAITEHEVTEIATDLVKGGIGAFSKWFTPSSTQKKQQKKKQHKKKKSKSSR